MYIWSRLNSVEESKFKEEVKYLANLYGIHPNTVRKIYREVEDLVATVLNDEQVREVAESRLGSGSAADEVEELANGSKTEGDRDHRRTDSETDK